MKPIKVRMLSIAIACLYAGPCFSAETPLELSSEAKSRLTSRYRSTKDPDERRRVCIEAIDKGLISCGKKVQILNEIFGTPPYFEKLRSGETSTAVVFFNSEQIIRESKPDAAAALSGWYFYCSYDSKMQITTYYVTNAPFAGSSR